MFFLHSLGFALSSVPFLIRRVAIYTAHGRSDRLHQIYDFDAARISNLGVGGVRRGMEIDGWTVERHHCPATKALYWASGEPGEG